jgi:hypothetical protein
VAQLDLRACAGRIGFDDREQAPAALRQALQVMLEHGHAGQPVQLRFLVAPVVGGLVAGLVENLRIRFDAERFLDRDVVVREEVTRHVQHRQRVGGPDAGIGIDVDRQLRLHRGGSVRKNAARLGRRRDIVRAPARDAPARPDSCGVESLGRFGSVRFVRALTRPTRP